MASRKSSVLDDLGNDLNDFLRQEEPSSASTDPSSSSVSQRPPSRNARRNRRRRRKSKQQSSSQVQSDADTSMDEHSVSPGPHVREEALIQESDVEEWIQPSVVQTHAVRDQPSLKSIGVEEIEEELVLSADLRTDVSSELSQYVAPAVPSVPVDKPLKELPIVPARVASITDVPRRSLHTEITSAIGPAIPAKYDVPDLPVKEDSSEIPDQVDTSIVSHESMLLPPHVIETPSVADASFNTDADKDQFFKALETQADKTLDYAELNQMIPDDSHDYSILSSDMHHESEQLDPTATILPPNIMSSFPMIATMSSEPVPAVTKKEPSSANDSKSLSSADEEQHAEDLASIQSNIDYIESSHVFQDGDVSIAESVSRTPVKSGEHSVGTVVSASKRSPSKLPRPSSAKKQVLSADTSIRSIKSSGSSSGPSWTMRPSSSAKKRPGTAKTRMLPVAQDPNTSVLSSVSIEEIEQRDREAKFMDNLLDQAQTEAHHLRDQVSMMQKQLEDLQKDHVLLTAENQDLKQTLSQSTVGKKTIASQPKDVQQLERNLEEQEQLLRGFQSENEKLVTEMAKMKHRLADENRQAQQRQDELSQEIMELRTQLREKPGRESVMSRTRDDEFETRLEALMSEARAKELELKIQLDETNQALARALKDPTGELTLRHEKQVQDLKEQHKQELRNLESEVAVQKQKAMEAQMAAPSFAKEREQYESTIESLQSDLEVVRTRHTSIVSEKDAQISTMELKLQNLESRLQTELTALKEANIRNTNLKQHIVKLEDQVQAASSNNAPGPSELSKLPRSASISELIKAAKPSGAEIEVITEVKARLNEAEEDRIRIQEETAARLRSLRAEHESLVANYDSRTKKLQEELETYREKTEQLSQQLQVQRSPVEAVSGESAVALREIIHGLRDELRSRKADEKRLKEEADEYRLKYMSVSAELQQQSAITKQLENNLNQLRENLGQAQRKLTVTAKGSDSSSGVIQSLRDEIVARAKQNQELQTKLDANEAIRQSMHDNFLIILKQSQEETSKSAMDHHERALRILREENRASAMQLIAEETKRWREQIMEVESEAAHFKIRAETLETQLSDARVQIRNLENQLEDAQARTKSRVGFVDFTDVEDDDVRRPGPEEAESIRAFGKRSTVVRDKEMVQEVEHLRKELELMRASRNPDEQHVYTLLKRLSEMEDRLSRREHVFRSSVQQKNPDREEVEELRQHYRSALRRKNEEISRFRSELDAVMHELEMLRAR